MHEISFSYDQPDSILGALLSLIQQKLRQPPTNSTSREAVVRNALTILIIDASQQRAQYLAGLLTAVNYHPVVVANALDAFTLFLQGGCLPIAIIQGEDDGSHSLFLHRLQQQLVNRYSWEPELIRLVPRVQTASQPPRYSNQTSGPLYSDSFSGLSNGPTSLPGSSAFSFDRSGGPTSLPGNTAYPGHVSQPGNPTYPFDRSNGHVSQPGNPTYPFERSDGHVSQPGNPTYPFERSDGHVSQPGNPTYPFDRSGGPASRSSANHMQPDQVSWPGIQPPVPQFSPATSSSSYPAVFPDAQSPSPTSQAGQQSFSNLPVIPPYQQVAAQQDTASNPSTPYEFGDAAPTATSNSGPIPQQLSPTATGNSGPISLSPNAPTATSNSGPISLVPGASTTMPQTPIPGTPFQPTRQQAPIQQTQHPTRQLSPSAAGSSGEIPAQPTQQPNQQPTRQPTGQPTRQPTRQPGPGSESAQTELDRAAVVIPKNHIRVYIDGQSLGRYQVNARLGSSEYSVVYQIYDRLREQDFALKAIQVDVVPYYMMRESLEEVTVFEQEADLLGQLKHPHILPVLKSGKTFTSGANFIYKVMPLCSDGPLQNWLARNGNGQHSFNELAPIVLQLAEALQFVHNFQITFQNFKMSNILVLNPTKKIQKVEVAFADFSVVQDGTFLPTSPECLPYIAPERWDGVVHPASDQYGLAAIAYELFTGRPPFQANSESIMKLLHTTRLPQPPSSLNPKLPSGVNAVLLRALAKNPAERFASMQYFIQALKQC